MQFIYEVMDMPVLVQMLTPYIQLQTVKVPQAQYVDKFVDVFPPSRCAEHGGGTTVSVSCSSRGRTCRDSVTDANNPEVQNAMEVPSTLQSSQRKKSGTDENDEKFFFWLVFSICFVIF